MLYRLFHTKKATLDFVLGLVLMIALVATTAMIGFKIFKLGSGGEGVKSLSTLAASIEEFNGVGKGSSSSVVVEIESGDVIFGFSKYDDPLMKLYSPTGGGIGDSKVFLHKFIRKPEECEKGLACVCYCEGHSTHEEKEATCGTMTCKSIEGVNFLRTADQELMAPSKDYLRGEGVSEHHFLLNGFALYNRETRYPEVAFDQKPDGLVNMKKPLGELTHLRIEKGQDDLVAICVYQKGRSCLDQNTEKAHAVAEKLQKALKEIEEDVAKNAYDQALQRIAVLFNDPELPKQIDSYTAEKLYYHKGIAHLGKSEYQQAEEAFQESLDSAETDLFTTEAKAKLEYAAQMKECQGITCERLSVDECEKNACQIECIVMERTIYEGEGPQSIPQKYCAAPAQDLITA